MKPVTSFIRNVLYQLKRLYGEEADIYTVDSTAFNPGTGKTTVNKSRYRVRRVIILDAEDMRKFSYDLTFIAANKNFTIGGHYDVAERGFIIDAKDLPAGFVYQQKYFIVYGGAKYETSEFREFNGAAWMVIGKRLAGAPVDTSQNIGMSSGLNLTQTIGEVVE